MEGTHRLVLEGTPYETGWWHGRLLADRIARVHGALQRAAFGDGPDALLLRQTFGLYVERTLPSLPERVRQELEGLAAGSGRALRDLLLTEVMRDGLRYAEGHGRLLGGRLQASPDGREGAYDPAGPDAEILRSEWLVVERRSEGAAPSVVVTWPGSVGAVAGTGRLGLCALAMEVEAGVERQTLHGVPFGIGLRLALEEAADLAGLLDRLSRTTAHEVLVLDPANGTAVRKTIDPVEVVSLDPPFPVVGEDAPIRLRWTDGAWKVAAPR